MGMKIFVYLGYPTFTYKYLPCHYTKWLSGSELGQVSGLEYFKLNPCVNVGIIKENTKKIDNQGHLFQQTNPYFMGRKRLTPCVAQEKKISQRPCSLGYG
jgi:hypothetical protein